MSSQANGLISTQALPEMTDLVRRKFLVAQEAYPVAAKGLYIMDSIDSGSSKRYQDTAIQQYASNKAEGANNKKLSVGIGYSKDLTLKTIGAEIEITLEMRQDKRDSDIVSQFTSLSMVCSNKMDLDFTHPLTFGASTSYTDADGATVSTATADTLALFSASHTLAFSSTTFTNIVATAPQFSLGALAAAEELFVTNMFDDFGKPIPMTPNTIITSNSPIQIHKVQEVLKSTSNPDGAHSGVFNPMFGMYRHMILPRLATTADGSIDTTKKNYWFLASLYGSETNSWRAFLVEKVSPTLVNPVANGYGQDAHNYNWTYSTYARYAYGVVGARGIVASMAV